MSAAPAVGTTANAATNAAGAALFSATIPAAEWDLAVALVRRTQRFLLCTHRKPDGDAIGSLLGLGHALQSMGKQVTLACADPAENNLARLPGADQIIVDLAGLYPVAAAAQTTASTGANGVTCDAGMTNALHQSRLPWEAIVSLDAAGPDRLGTIYEANRALFSQLPVLDIDHHLTSDRFGSVNLIDPGAAATAEVVALFLERLGVPPDARVATCLLAGILTDSLSFQTESTTPRTLRAAAALVEAGAPLPALAFSLFRQRPVGSALLWSRALGTLQLAAGGRVAWIEVTRAMVEASGPGAESGGLSGFAGSIVGVEVGMVIEEGADGNIYAGLRSPSIDVAALAAQFGGGGHKRAAGCHFPAPASLAESRDRLVTAAESFLTPAERPLAERPLD